MATDRSHKSHKGEISIQKKRHTPDELASQISNYIAPDMPQQHAEFFANLPYLPIGTTDTQGRPWASLLVTPSTGMHVLPQNEMRVSAHISPGDPFLRAVTQTHSTTPEYQLLFAGVGVDFANRRRNKIAGNIVQADTDTSGKLHLRLKSNQHLGNCPKYITVRTLVPHTRKPQMVFDHFDYLDKPLSQECKDVINQASTLFLATKHQPEENAAIDDADMGFNHRGGAPGFVRVYEEPQNPGDKPPHSNSEANSADTPITTYLVLPDYSGNRFYQSLGNIQSDEQVGLAFPDFATGNMLHITGKAENLFDEEAEAIMPRMSLVTRIQVTGAVLIKEALNLRMTSDEEFSPYNPPIRYLRQELEEMGHSSHSDVIGNTEKKATLISVQKLTDTISTFSFQLSTPTEASLPGGFGVFDFSKRLDAGYSHMDEVNPQAVNEDYIRTWTLSSAPTFDAGKKAFSPVEKVDITVKLKPGGLISSFLHNNSALIDQDANRSLELTLKGTGGGFSCFSQTSKAALPQVPNQMLWVAGGVGITPFMSMWNGLMGIMKALPEDPPALSTNIVLVFAGRDDDLNLLRHFLKDQDSLPSSISLTILAYQSVSKEKAEAKSTQVSLKEEFPQAPIQIQQRRLQASDFTSIDNLLNREVFLCGPDGLMRSVQEWLQSQGGDALKIHQESYFF